MANEGIIQKAAENRQAAVTPEKQLAGLIKAMQGEIRKALPSVLTPERFTRMVLTAVRNTPKLAQCDQMSFLAAMMTAAQLGMEPNTPLGQAYLLPYKNHGRMEVQFQLGYKGLIDLAYRSGEVETVQAHCVYENDDFEFEYGLEPKLVHKPAKTEKMRIYRRICGFPDEIRRVRIRVYERLRNPAARPEIFQILQHQLQPVADEFRGDGEENRHQARAEICADEGGICPRRDAG